MKRQKSLEEQTELDRQEEKEGYDGMDDMFRTDSVDANHPQERWISCGERDLSNRPDFYKRIGVVGDLAFYPSDLSKVPGRMIMRKTRCSA